MKPCHSGRTSCPVCVCGGGSRGGEWGLLSPRGSGSPIKQQCLLLLSSSRFPAWICPLTAWWCFMSVKWDMTKWIRSNRTYCKCQSKKSHGITFFYCRDVSPRAEVFITLSSPSGNHPLWFAEVWAGLPWRTFWTRKRPRSRLLSLSTLLSWTQPPDFLLF